MPFLKAGIITRQILPEFELGSTHATIDADIRFAMAVIALFTLVAKCVNGSAIATSREY